MLHTKVLNHKNGVELIEVCLTNSDGQTDKTWVVKSKRKIHYATDQIPFSFATRDDADKFFHEECIHVGEAVGASKASAGKPKGDL
jgi:hypothetical protein